MFIWHLYSEKNYNLVNMQVQYDNTFTFTDIIIHTMKYDGLYIKL